MIKNSPQKYIDEYNVDSVRGAYENAAKWYYYLAKEGLASGLPIEFAYDAMRKSGDFYYEKLYQDIESVDGFINRYFDFGIEKVHEGTINESDDVHAELELGYCPFVAAWLKLTDDEELIKKLCAGCLEMKRSMVKKLGFAVEQNEAIASGDDKCVFTFKKQAE